MIPLYASVRPLPVPSSRDLIWDRFVDRTFSRYSREQIEALYDDGANRSGGDA